VPGTITCGTITCEFGEAIKGIIAHHKGWSVLINCEIPAQDGIYTGLRAGEVLR
jgi:hypothetical protein